LELTGTKLTVKHVTIKTIAKECNVTPATVSKALRNSSDISIATKKKINQLAIELGYKPNLLARNLVNKKVTLSVLLSAI
jgi:LacI family transcriptional regulator